MNILFAGAEDLEYLQSKYIILELDTIRLRDSDTKQTAWCLIEKVTLQDIPVIETYRELHNNMMRNYRSKNWKYCEDALEHLTGRWQGELDTFYKEIAVRIAGFKQQDPGADWAGVYVKQVAKDIAS
jgi:hypothetical protein